MKYRTGRTIGTTIYRDGESQPCAWAPNDPELAKKIVSMLNGRDPKNIPVSGDILRGKSYSRMEDRTVTSSTATRVDWSADSGSCGSMTLPAWIEWAATADVVKRGGA